MWAARPVDSLNAVLHEDESLQGDDRRLETILPSLAKEPRE